MDWVDKYWGYLMFGAGMFAGWTIASLLAPAPTVVVQSAKGLGRYRRRRLQGRRGRISE